MQGRTTAVQLVELFDETGHASVPGHIQKFPFHAAVFVPLIVFGQILPHEQQLLSGMCHHIAVAGAQIRELVRILSGHLPQHRSLAVHHFVMGQNQHEMLAVRVNHGKGQLIVVVGAEIGIIADIIEEIVHPPHVPLHGKTESVIVQIPGDLGPGGGLLRDGQRPSSPLLDHAVDVLQKFHGLQVLVAAIDIGYPLSIVLSVVEIQHRSHRIHADAIRMILFDPVQGVGDQIVTHFRPSVIVDESAPVGVEPLSGILMLVQACPVERGQSPGIPREMGRNPVQNHADARFVQLVYEVHEVLRGPVSGRRRIVADDLIAPGTVERMLHYRHQLHMRISHFLHIGNHFRRQFAIIVVQPPILRLGERTQIHFIDADRFPVEVLLLPGRDPAFILPGKPVDIADHGCGIRPELLAEGVGIRLQISEPALGLELELIVFPFFHAGNEDFKDAGIPQSAHLVQPSVPAVKIPDHADPHSVGRPNRKMHSFHAVQRHHMSAKNPIGLIMNPRIELRGVLLRDHRFEAIGIFDLLLIPVLIGNPIGVASDLLFRDQDCEITVFVLHLHLIILALFPMEHYGDRVRMKSLHYRGVARLMGAQQPVRIVLLRIDNGLDLRPVHHFIQLFIHNHTLLLFFFQAVNQKPAAQLRLKPGRLGRHQPPRIRHRKQLLHRSGIHQEGSSPFPVHF